MEETSPQQPLARLLERLDSTAEPGRPGEASIATHRRGDQMLPELYGQYEPMHDVVDTNVCTALRVRLFIPASALDDTIVVYYHGGGWVAGTIESHEGLCRTLAAAANLIVASVDYRLAPECPFPAGVEDAWSAVKHFAARFAHVAVAGDSAGGNLAAACSKRAVDRGLDLTGQLLLYPILGADFDTPSYLRHANGPILTREAMRWFYAQVDPSGKNRINPDLVPLAAESLAGLPPTVVAVGGLDPLESEAITYCQRLERAGSTVELLAFPDAPHGFMTFGDALPGARTAARDAAVTFRGLIEASPA